MFLLLITVAAMPLDFGGMVDQSDIHIAKVKAPVNAVWTRERVTDDVFADRVLAGDGVRQIHGFPAASRTGRASS